MNIESHELPFTPKRSGFTLVEVLVVIAILLVLGALVFSGTKQVFSAAHKSVSLDNLKELQTANGVYAAGNNGRFVATYTKDAEGNTGGLWDRNPEFLDILLGELNYTGTGTQESRVSPQFLDPVAYKSKANGYDTLKASYGMVNKIGFTNSPPDTDSSYLGAELTSPSQTAAFVTSVNWLVQYSGRVGWDGTEGKVNAPRMAYRHGGKALVVYYDGHVGEITPADMVKLDRRGGKNNSFWTGVNGTL